MANRGSAFFDGKGMFFKTPEEATMSDLAAILGRVGDGESLAPGIAKTLFTKRLEIERIFADHDEMVRSKLPAVDAGDDRKRLGPVLGISNIATLRPTG
jgi:hypothetical protein